MEQQPNRGVRGFFSRFRRDRGGAIAPLAAVAITAALIGVGASIDISRLVTARTQLQDAVDSADLALARMPASTSDADMKTKATAWITANVTDPNIKNLLVGTPVRTLGQVQLNVTASINTTMASLMGMSSLPLEGHAIVKYGTTHVELALVLDNTGSMNDDNKLTSLKAAATTLVNTLSASAIASKDPNALKVGVVPFSMAVNVGTQYHTTTPNYTAPWLLGAMPSAYGAGADAVDASHPDRFVLLKNMNNTAWGGCVESRPMPYDVQDTAPDPLNPATMFVPFFAPDEPDQGYYNLPGYGMQYTVWPYDGQHAYIENNYLRDLVSDNYGNTAGGNWLAHQNNLAKYTGTPTPGSSPVWTNGTGPNAGCTVQALQRLTTTTSTVLTQIAGMVAGGDTEIPLGLMWGWHVLSPNAPFADGTAYGTSGTIKVIVLVTDGANTYGTSINPNYSHYTALGYAANKRIDPNGTAATTATALNSRLSQLCTNLKTKNPDGTWKINIYTVPLEVTDSGIKSLLQGCVTDPANYLDVSSSSGLANAFANIAGSISALRVSH